MIAFLLPALSLIFRFSPNLRQPHVEGILPGAVLSLVCWLTASAGLKIYFSVLGTFQRTYGSLGSVVSLLIWLYVVGASILIGGELNSVILRAVAERGND
jgi:membrane protein